MTGEIVRVTETELGPMMSNSRRASARLGPWIEEAVERHRDGEDVLWELTTVPTEIGAMAPAIVLWIPAAVLGEVLSGLLMAPDVIYVTAERVDKAVRMLLGQMRAERSRILKQVAEEGGIVARGGG
jgi:hypothetical protein